MADPEIERVRKLARVLDDYFVDPILGFVLPGVGDVATSVVGLYTVSVALRRRVSPVIIARMLLNLAFDSLLGIIPFVGDIGDILHKANTKNLALLESRVEHGGRASARDWLIVGLAFLLFVLAITASVYLAYRLIEAIAHRV